MKWKRKPKIKHGDERILKYFLIIPKIINRDVRWLEFGYIHQTYHYSYALSRGWWTKETWVSKEIWEEWVSKC